MRRYMLLAAMICPLAAHAVDVQITGAVTAPGLKQLSGHARLSDGALASPLGADAYPLGASWQRPSLQVEQSRLKAGVLFDLDSARLQALRDNRTALADTLASLRDWLQPMPVTGREVALLDPRSVEVNAVENRPVGEGDTLFYPRRPTTIQVVGAVNQRCVLPFVPMQNAQDYLGACKPSNVADGDWIFVIQPDGRITKQGAGLWNRGPSMPLAPGAVIYVPLRETGLHGVSPELNQALAAFLATQPLAAAEGDR
ncbi:MULTISPECIES: capsule biosynthesis GfcC family protein [unclassified Dyella]|uniref:capsule biosynthesis GfcC family protein n=1 Tax=unclassified Dyella TaxID=2634549 RepID=UPI003F8F9416